MAKKKLTIEEVKHVVSLANLSIDEEQLKSLAKQFEETLDFVDRLQEVDIKNIAPTSQVTGVANVFREDEIETDQVLPQEIALKSAPRTHRGFFVVPSVFD